MSVSIARKRVRGGTMKDATPTTPRADPRPVFYVLMFKFDGLTPTSTRPNNLEFYRSIKSAEARAAELKCTRDIESIVIQDCVFLDDPIY